MIGVSVLLSFGFSCGPLRLNFIFHNLNWVWIILWSTWYAQENFLNCGIVKCSSLLLLWLLVFLLLLLNVSTPSLSIYVLLISSLTNNFQKTNVEISSSLSKYFFRQQPIYLCYCIQKRKYPVLPTLCSPIRFYPYREVPTTSLFPYSPYKLSMLLRSPVPCHHKHNAVGFNKSHYTNMERCFTIQVRSRQSQPPFLGSV